jgi:gluconolactonase
MTNSRLFLVVISSWLVSAVLLASAGQVDLQKLGPPADLVSKDTVAIADTVVCFLEGPAFDGKDLYFSDIAGNRILKLDAKGVVSTFRADSGRTNGNTIDPQGRLLSCEGAENGPGGRRRITRTDLKTGAVTVLTERFEGKRYNSPNDICVDAKGRVWFTDPRYSVDRSDLEMDVEGVYRIDTDGSVHRVLTQKDIDRPNGVALSPDEKSLYVIDSHPKVGGNRKIWSFAIGTDGSLSNRKLIYDFGKGRGGDGLRVDVKGNLWVAAGISVPRGPGESLEVPPGVYTIDPSGKLLGRVAIPENLITNLCFAGPDRKTVYVTAGKTLYKFQSNVAGR